MAIYKLSTAKFIEMEAHQKKNANLLAHKKIILSPSSLFLYDMATEVSTKGRRSL